MLRRIYLVPLIAAGVLLLSVTACVKKAELAGEPYPPHPQPVISFYGKPGTVIQGSEGDTITLQVAGIKQLAAGYRFLLNGISATIVSATDSLLSIKIPPSASSGPGSIATADGQFYYGPTITITGKVSIDRDFNNASSTVGANGYVSSVFKKADNNYLLMGGFTNYNNQSTPLGRIAQINPGGNFMTSNAGLGASGGIATLLPVTILGQTRYVIGGNFGGYYSSRFSVSNITQINTNLSIDSVTVAVQNPDPENAPQNNTDTVANFNARLFNGNVVRIFQDVDPNKIIAVGNFDSYYRVDYANSIKGNYYPYFRPIRNFVRMSLSEIETGRLDTTYNYSYIPATGKYDPNLNGDINDAVQLSNKTIVVAGSFTALNTPSNPAAPVTAVPGVMALTSTGGINTDFASAIGSGANGTIFKITYNATTKKILLTGNFTQFNNRPAKGVVMLNEDGTADPSFTLKSYDGGLVTYAGQLSNGKVIIAGSFNKYDGVVRQGFAILNADGSLASGYNNSGAFSGTIYGIYEVAADKLMIFGSISLFDNTRVGNIVQLKIAP
ncbi:hypothetical protein LL912_23600 [Niabella sp. CC-SYL272]|uniref:hypothetical protein n=1 Tax=Niabella agricola TaxID=2891571 RepID=UPI001F3C69BD|nr:hypothetical protein [Niabella agricola]MCF3111793.1 hypothetical protein [Niabella agricola]